MSRKTNPISTLPWRWLPATMSSALLALGATAAFAEAAKDDRSKPIKPDPAPFRYASDADRERMQRQAPLLEAARPIREAAEQDAGENGSSGFASVMLGPDSVVLAWKGALPRAVREAVDEARKDVDVDVLAAKHSRAQLENAASRVTKALKEDHGGVAFAVQIPADGSELIVDTEGDVERTKRKLPPVSVPVHVRHQDVGEPSSRLADSPPYWGGARISNADNGAFCSSGFGVTDGWQSYILTAGHCGRGGGDWYNGDWSRWIGTAGAEHVDYDLMLIPTYAGNYIYDGGVGTNEFSKRVAGWDWTYAYEWLCVSGSVSGAVCNIQAGNHFTFSYCSTDMYGHYECYRDLVLAYQRDGKTAVRPGDSGGPVFSLWGYDVVAKGIISGRANGGTTVIFQDFTTANRVFGIRTL